MGGLFIIPVALWVFSDPPLPASPCPRYLEAQRAIAEANRLFGFDNWSSRVVDGPALDVCMQVPRLANGKGGMLFRAAATAIVRVSVGGSDEFCFREEVGTGSGDHPERAIAIEHAKKEAVTDATKRALRLFGEALGNCLQHTTVTGLDPPIKGGDNKN
jgi:DNA repair and recombination protein RAD52